MLAEDTWQYEKEGTNKFFTPLKTEHSRMWDMDVYMHLAFLEKKMMDQTTSIMNKIQ